jgi:type II secretory pathway component PulF
MPEFKISRHQQSGESLAGTITVASQADVVQMLRDKEYMPDQRRGSTQKARTINIGFLSKIKIKDIAIFCRSSTRCSTPASASSSASTSSVSSSTT